MSRARPADPRTIAARSGVDTDTAHGAVMPPLYLSSNYSFAGFDQKRKYDYSRSGNPTRDVLAETLAELEGGAGGVVTATGMGAITLVLNALLQPGERLKELQDTYQFTEKMMLAEQAKSMPFGAVWDEYCRRAGCPLDGELYPAVAAYEAKVLPERV